MKCFPALTFYKTLKATSINVIKRVVHHLPSNKITFQWTIPKFVFSFYRQLYTTADIEKEKEKLRNHTTFIKYIIFEFQTIFSLSFLSQ